MDLAKALTQFNPHTATPEALAAQVAAWAQEAQRLQEQADLVARQRQEIHLKDTKIKALTLELAYHKRIKFCSTSEVFTAQQRDLFNETQETDLNAMQAELEQLSSTPRVKAKPTGRKPLPAELPRVEQRHEPDSCACGACRHCETITAAAIPAAIIDGGLATPSLHAWVVIQKYLDHLPLYRIEQISTRHGVTISRSTLAEWIGRIGVALQPLADRLIELLKQRTVLHADETPVPQLDPGKGKTKRAYLWAYRSNNLEPDAPIVVFEFEPNRSGAHAQSFLADWQGHLMVDDYAGYKKLLKTGITELACLAHARRKFFDLHAANQHPVAEEALQRIAELYRIESEAQDYSIEERQRWRAEHAKPRLDAMHLWLVQLRKSSAEGSALSKAIDYSLKRWPAFTRYADSGHLPIDNNPIENAIRPIALGKKNWLFAGSERAGKRAAAIQTLLATAKANEIEPYAWLKETLEKLPTCPNSRIDELLPLRT